jgi:hypothetical protein
MDFDKACKPFDRTYADVTSRICDFAKRLPTPDTDWLNCLIEVFAAERDEWEVRSELSGYRLRMTLFRYKILRLVGGAYLHISYDLPRAMADEWPGSGNWTAGPNPDRGKQIYFQLSDIFPAALIKSASDFRTVGWPAILQRRTAEDVLAPAAMWVDYQRQGAWLNAEFLARSTNRNFVEMKMAEAMTAALDDASIWRPWSLAHLRPPNFILRSPNWASWATLAPFLDGLAWVLAVALPTAIATWQLSRERFRLETLGSFVGAWGMLTLEYVSYAVREPEGFDAHRARRRVELGIVPSVPAALG